jgi:hypothetical protein
MPNTSASTAFNGRGVNVINPGSLFGFGAACFGLGVAAIVGRKPTLGWVLYAVGAASIIGGLIISA